MRVRDVSAADQSSWLRMRHELWPDAADEHSAAIIAYFTGTPTFIDHALLCENDDGEVVGFAELQIRNYAEGSENAAVPFLEGWFVDASHRGQGAGALLIAGAEAWARSQGYCELASDADVENHRGIAAHLGLGFREVARSVSFLKKLS